MTNIKKETSKTTLEPKKRGRPAGSKNKTKVKAVKHKKPISNTNKSKESSPIKRGRPVGSHNKPKAITTKPITNMPKHEQQVNSKNDQQSDTPKVEYTLEPIRGNIEITKEFGFQSYMIYQVSKVSMELKAEDMPKAVQKYKDSYNELPTRAILHEHNEKLLPYLHAQAPGIAIGLTMGGTALWEIQFQIPVK